MPVKAKRMIGLSIGSRTIAVAQIHITASGVVEVERLGVADTPPNAIDYSGVADTKALSRTIQDLLIDNNIGHGEMALAISGNNVITRLLTLPSMSGNEMLEVLKGEVENYAALSGEEPVLDFHIVDRITEGIQQKTEVLVVAMTEDLLNSYTVAMEAANVELSVVETMPLAILRIPTVHQFAEETPNTVMLVSIEENSGTTVIVRDGVVLLVHSIESGSDRLSEEPVALEELADEFRSTLSYCQTTFPQNRKIEEIIVFMNGVNSNRICDRLREFLNMPVLLAGNASPLLETAGDQIQDRAMDYSLSSYAAIGAAARAMAGENDVSINALHPKKFQTSGLRRKTLKLLLLPLTIVLLSICANVFLNARANSTMNKLISIRQNPETQILQILKEISSMETDLKRLEAQVSINQTVIDSTNRVDWVPMLREISKIIPKTIWLSEFLWKKDKDVALNGFAVSYDSIFMFRDKLIESPYFDSVRLLSLQGNMVERRSFAQFEILCQIGRRAKGL